jgi:hypothetical protein
MPEIKNQEVVEKIVKIAKKNLKPAKKPEDNLTNINWRFELTQKNLRSLVSILVLSGIFSGVYWWIPTYVKPEEQNQAISNMFLSVTVATILSQNMTPAMAMTAGRRLLSRNSAKL